MKIHNRILRKNEKGATAVYAAVVLALLLMFAALGVDVNYLYGVRNELHNAADAGSLAGASKLFDSDGDLTRDEAITEATRITSANKTGNEDVVAGTVETGHWSFGSKTFTASENTTQLNGWQEMSFSELDKPDSGFINAVRVRADRSDTPSFFAGIFSLLGSNFNQLFVSADAVAYIGFPGTFQVDQPIAICKESIFDGVSYSCNMGRMINSGGNPATANTAGWTNFTQPCETATPPSVKPYICGEGSPLLHSGQGIGTIGGETSSPKELIDCWLEESTYNGIEKAKNWLMTLPVVECPDNNVSNCAKLVGAVDVNLIWIIEQNDPHYEDVPRQMAITDDNGALIPNGSWVNNPWTCSGDGFTCWKDFVDNFHLANVDGPPLNDADYEEMYQNKNMFFLPDCEYHEPIGGSGGENFGIMARIPKLVE